MRKMPKILIADDDQITRHLLRMLLRQNNYDTLAEAHDGADALSLCGKLQPDVVFLDINMPKMDGFDALREIRKQHPQIIAIMISASATMDNVKGAIDKGAHGFVVKPFNEQKVMATLQKALANGAS